MNQRSFQHVREAVSHDVSRQTHPGTNYIYKEIRHRYQIGMQVVSSKGQILGTMSSVFQDGDRLFAVINEDYEVDLTGASEVLDLFGTLKLGNPALRDPHIRLGAAS